MSTKYSTYHFDDEQKIVWFWDGTSWAHSLPCHSAEDAKNLFESFDEEDKINNIPQELKKNPVTEKESVSEEHCNKKDVNDLDVILEEHITDSKKINTGSFFQDISCLSINMKISISVFSPDSITVVVSPVLESKDKAYQDMPPISFSGKPEEIDEMFLKVISSPFEEFKKAVHVSNNFIEELEQRKLIDEKAKKEKELIAKKYEALKVLISKQETTSEEVSSEILKIKDIDEKNIVVKNARKKFSLVNTVPVSVVQKPTEDDNQPKLI